LTFIVLSSFSHPFTGQEPNPDAEGIGWAVHLYFHQTVNIKSLGDGTLEASFKAREIVPLLWNGKAKWLLLDNDSTLRKEKGGDWLMHRYGLKAFNLLSNEEAKWAALQGRAGKNEMLSLKRLRNLRAFLSKLLNFFVILFSEKI